MRSQLPGCSFWLIRCEVVLGRTSLSWGSGANCAHAAGGKQEDQPGAWSGSEPLRNAKFRTFTQQTNPGSRNSQPGNSRLESPYESSPNKDHLEIQPQNRWPHASESTGANYRGSDSGRLYVKAKAFDDGPAQNDHDRVLQRKVSIPSSEQRGTGRSREPGE
jgi:hypothetical protein